METYRERRLTGSLLLYNLSKIEIMSLSLK
jgi:hypothetical protein